MNRGKLLLHLAIGQEDKIKKSSSTRRPLQTLQNGTTKRSFAPPYVELFDKGRWEELDNYLRLTNLSRKTPPVSTPQSDSASSCMPKSNERHCTTTYFDKENYLPSSDRPIPTSPPDSAPQSDSSFVLLNSVFTPNFPSGDRLIPSSTPPVSTPQSDSSFVLLNSAVTPNSPSSDQPIPSSTPPVNTPQSDSSFILLNSAVTPNSPSSDQPIPSSTPSVSTPQSASSFVLLNSAVTPNSPSSDQPIPSSTPSVNRPQSDSSFILLNSAVTPNSPSSDQPIPSSTPPVNTPQSDSSFVLLNSAVTPNSPSSDQPIPSSTPSVSTPQSASSFVVLNSAVTPNAPSSDQPIPSSTPSVSTPQSASSFVVLNSAVTPNSPSSDQPIPSSTPSVSTPQSASSFVVLNSAVTPNSPSSDQPIPSSKPPVSTPQSDSWSSVLSTSCSLNPQNEAKNDLMSMYPDDALVFAVTPSGNLEPMSLLALKWSPELTIESSRNNIKRKRLFQEENESGSGKDLDTPLEPPKQKRRWDRKNYCIFCEKLVTNFSRHMIHIHSNEEPVLRYAAVLDENPKVRKQRRQEIFDDLRKKGNFRYNQSVLRDSLTPPTCNLMLPVKRRAKSNKATDNSVKNIIICKMCSGYYCRKTFHKHVKVCKMNTRIEECSEGKVSAIKEIGLELREYPEEASNLMKEKIFPLLRKDTRGIAAMNDPLIVSVGCDFLSNHLDLKDRYNVTSHMRDAGALLLKMKEKDPSILSLKDCLIGNQLENLTSAVKDICKHDDKTGQVGVVGGPARLAWVIKECSARLLDDTLSSSSISENYKQVIKGQLLDFQMLIKRRWKFIVSTNAEKTRKKNSMKKEVIMPENEDIKTFLTEVTALEKRYSQKLLKETNANYYERLCEVVIAKLIVLNRRRSGEVANAELEFYLKRPPKGNVSTEILEQLSEEEAQAFHQFDMMIIPGKIIRAVPILMTKETAQNIDLIISCRNTLGIPPTNLLLFARPGTQNPFVGSTVMRQIRQSMDLKKPDHLTATGLRHHCATMSHHSDKALDKEDLAEHMGHTLETHKRKYRFPLEVVQKGKIAPHLLKLGGVTVEDLEPQFSNFTEEDLQQSIDQDDPGNEVLPYDNEQHKPDESPVEKQLLAKGMKISGTENTDVLDDPDWCQEEVQSISHASAVRKTPQKKKRRWSEKEKAIVIDSFKEFIKSSRNPGSKLCKELIEKEPILKGRTWAQVNILIDNYNKGKLSLPLQYRYLRS